MNLLDYKEVARKLSIHPRSVYTFKDEEPTFPSPVRLSNKRVRWVEEEVDAWIKTKKGDANDNRNDGKETFS